jgi:GAF domain-containing protein
VDEQQQPASPNRINAARLAESVESLRAEDLAGGELRASLEFVVQCTQDVFACDGAGVMLIDEGQALHYVGATDATAAAFEAAQDQTGQGPCIDSLMLERLVATADLGSDPRWPQLTSAISGLGIGGILGVPIRLGGITVGSLNTFSSEPHDWDRSEVAAIEAYAAIVEELLASAVLAQQRNTIVDQLTNALDSRVVIERGIGVTMATFDIDAVEAFDVLRRRARASRRKVSEVAAEVIADRRFTSNGDHPPSH